MKTVTAAIIVEHGKVLIARRAPGQMLAGMWEFPGGKVEGAETLAQCLVRELREELGLTVVVGTIVAESTYCYDHGELRLVAMDTRIISGTPTPVVHDQIHWVAPSDLEGYNLAPADIPIARIVVKKTSEPNLAGNGSVGEDE